MATVLFVDDNRNIREFCRRELERSEYRVLVAANGREASEICGEERPDVVVLDIRMPDMDGYATVRVLSERFPDLPVILFTAQVDIEDLSCVSRGAWACVAKSEDLRDLKTQIALALEASRMPRIRRGTRQVE